MTKFNRQHKKQMLKESSILLEYNRVKSRTKPGRTLTEQQKKDDGLLRLHPSSKYNSDLFNYETLIRFQHPPNRCDLTGGVNWC